MSVRGSLLAWVWTEAKRYPQREKRHPETGYPEGRKRGKKSVERRTGSMQGGRGERAPRMPGGWRLRQPGNWPHQELGILS